MGDFDGHLEKCGVDRAAYEDGSDAWKSLHVVQHLTNGAVLELVSLKTKSSATWPRVVEWLKVLYGDTWPVDVLPQTLSTRVSRLKNEVQYLVKKKKDSLKDFLDTPFELPHSSTVQGKSETESHVSASSVHAPPQEFPSQNASAESWSSESFQALKEKKDSFQRQAKNLKRKVKRRDSAADQHEHELSELQEKLHEVHVENRRLSKAVDERRMECTRLQKNLSDVKKRAERQLQLKGDIYAATVDALVCEGDNDELSIDKLCEENKTLHHTLAQVENELLEKEETLFEAEEYLESIINHSAPIETFDVAKGAYKPNVVEACMTLLSHNVGIEHVCPVIRTAVQALTGLVVGRLPSVGRLSQMQTDMKAVSLMHVAEEITQSDDSTLHTDATTKFFRKYAGYQVTTAKGSLSLGMVELHTGSAEHTLETFKQLLSNIQDACAEAGLQDDVGRRIVGNIKNTMSDRGSVEKAFNRIFDEYCQSLLPSLHEDWDELPEKVRTKIATVNHFFCGLHYIVGSAEQAEAVFQEWEKILFDGPVGAGTLSGQFVDKSSAVVRLIRTACKLFTKHGSEQVGLYENFRAFVEDHDRTFSLTTFRGNRFNILFFLMVVLYGTCMT